MGTVTFDVSGEDPEKNSTVRVYETPDVGIYPAKIVSCVAAHPEGKNPRLEVGVQITKPANNNFGTLMEYVVLTDAAAWKFDQLLLAVGIATKTKRKGKFEDKSLVGKTIQIYVTHETGSYTPPGKTEPVTTVRARINTFLAKGASVPEGLKVAGGSSKATASKETEEPEEEDLVALGEAADGEDGEAIDRLTELAGENDLDPNDYQTWAELATALSGEEPAEDKAAEEGEEAGDEDDLDALSEAADGDDEEDADLLAAQERLTELAKPLGIDPDELDTWADVALAISEAQEAGEGDATDAPDYESMAPLALKKLCKERSLPSTGTKEEIIERLQEFDAVDPFKE